MDHEFSSTDQRCVHCGTLRAQFDAAPEKNPRYGEWHDREKARASMPRWEWWLGHVLLGTMAMILTAGICFVISLPLILSH